MPCRHCGHPNDEDECPACNGWNGKIMGTEAPDILEIKEYPDVRTSEETKMPMIPEFNAKFQEGYHAGKAAADKEIERLQQCCTQRGERMQIMREWIEDAGAPGLYSPWDYFLTDHPEVSQWFDENGVPK